MVTETPSSQTWLTLPHHDVYISNTCPPGTELPYKLETLFILLTCHDFYLPASDSVKASGSLVGVGHLFSWVIPTIYLDYPANPSYVYFSLVRLIQLS